MTFLVVGEVAGARPGMGRVCGPSQEQAFGGMVTVSVIVPVYNTSERLAACLDALLAQTFRDFEVILVNDGSTDCSGDICREYVSRHPQVFRLLDGPNGGVSVARNRGLDAARGEWVAFCDSDDEALPEWLETLHRNAVRDGADLSYCSFDDISPRETRHRCSFPMEGQATVRLKGREELERRLLLMDGNPSPQTFDMSKRLRLTRGECMTVAQFYPPATGANISRSMKLMRFCVHFLSSPKRAQREKLLGRVKPELCDIFIPETENEEMSLYVDDLVELYGQALERYPRMMEELTAHMETGAPLGKDFAPTFG